MRGNIYILTGPSGVGKTTVATELLGQLENLKKVVTCTTRPPREGEVPGTSYHFLDPQTFEQHIEQGDMLEWAKVYDNYYGSRKQDVETLLASGVDVLFVVDVQGARTIKKQLPKATVVFLQAESQETLLARLQKRDQGSTVNLDERIAAAKDELTFAKNADHVVMNREGQLNETVKQIQTIMEQSPQSLDASV